jgi:hypothetical protein
MTTWNGKEPHIMTASASKPEPEKPNISEWGDEDPINASMHLWVLRLWIVCALVIIAYAICNYLAHWLAK